jgi:hypothetical protein
MSMLRPCALSSHPLYHKRYILATPAIDQFYGQVQSVIRHKTPGMIVTAVTRYGKTYAIRYICTKLRSSMPGIVVVDFDCRGDTAPKRGDFYSRLLYALKHKDALVGRMIDKEIRLINRVLEALFDSKQKIILVFADEAQNLSVEEYRWLTWLSNEVERNGFRMITFLVGQPQLIHQKAALKRSGEAQIVGRFMIEEHSFKGVASREDAAACLMAYDRTYFPIDSDWSYTRFCLPDHWAEGYRCVQDTEVIWNAFEAVHREISRGRELEIPMTYFSRAVEIALLYDCIDADGKESKLTSARWALAVEACGFKNAQEDVLSAIENEKRTK